jgi:hypothetical protein
MPDAGYEGAFDLEIARPRIDSEGCGPATQRSRERTDQILEKLHA